MSFTHVLNLSISASWLVLAIVAARSLLKSAPKALHCCLWALVALRLLCPLSFESDLSLIPSREVIPESYLYLEPSDEGFDAPARLEIVTNPVYEGSLTVPTDATVDRVQNWDLFATVIWTAGMGAMAIYAAFSYLSLRLRVRLAGWTNGNVWECDEIDSPFILGILRPRIYLPAGMDEATKGHVLAHEQAHLKRLDHLWKPLGFALLTVHWFNPIMWLAYVLLCRDIELACDEKVIRKLQKPAVRAYSEALIRCSVNHRMIAACPLAFGEVGVKGRIRSMLHYRKPGFWIILIAVIVSIAVAVCFLTDPKPEAITVNRILTDEDCSILHIQEEDYFQIRIPKDALPEDVANGREHTFDPGAIIVAEYGDIRLNLCSARMSGDELLLEIHIDQTLTEEGILMLTGHPFEDDPEKDADVAHGEVYDAQGVYADAAVRRGLGEEQFSVGIKLDVWKQALEYVEFEMTGIWVVTYTFGEEPEPTWPAEKGTTPKLEAIVKEEGWFITSNVEEELGFMFYTHWLPEGFESGYSFADGELVLAETETTRLEMKYAMLDGEQYCFDFLFTYDLPETGTIHVPYFVNIKGIDSTLKLSEGQTYDFTKTIAEGVTVTHVRGTEGFSLLVDKEVYETLSDYLSVTLEGVYALTYVKSGTGLPMGQYLEVETHDGKTLMESYVITDDLHLIGCEKGTLFPIERDLGQLHIVTLDGTPVEEKWKGENQRAWHCEAFGTTHYLLQQEDGRLYVAKLTKDGKSISELYQLSGSGEPLPTLRDLRQYNFALESGATFDVPMFTLRSDGTFLFHTSVVSSYLGIGSYTLTEEELILKTEDGLYTWHFDVTAGGFAYDAERSSPISYMPDLKNSVKVQHGDLFRSLDQISYDPPDQDSLEKAIDAAIVEANIIDARASVHGVSHKILSELIACGVAPADGGTPIEELTLCILAAYTEKSTDGAMTYIEKTNVYPSKLSFRGQNGTYELTEYRKLSEEEAEAEFPTFAWEDLNANRDAYQAELLTVCREQENAQLARLQAQMTEVEVLFEIVASSPAQYSYPSAYINAHTDEWQKLLGLEAATVQYAFSRLASGEELGLKGMLMAEAAQTIISGWGESCTVTDYANGQDWFSKFYQNAKAVSDSTPWHSLRRDHPGCTLAIIHTEYLIFPRF